ncbi:PAS domain-containing sensor histidine kinase [Belnapia rosea]|uniref:PAS domain-containing sensor histidine kinase n=1 Tax=Belnapia rosea TaxID=938405 RepID=UPI001C409FFE|nr:PAS domain S-box protein [Belnapia rosea]
MGARLRACNWSASSLGSPERWAQPLKTLASVMLASNQPMFVAWGPRRIILYNDSYAEILGLKHPGALGQPFDRVWSEIWNELGPIMDRCYAGEPIQMDDILLVVQRHGRPEETHFAFSYTPVRDEAGRIAGVFCPCTEITAKVLADRRQAFRLELEDRLRDLFDPREVMTTAAKALGRHMDAAQVGYAEVDTEGHAITGGEFHDGRIPGFTAGRYRLQDYGPAMVADMAAGRVVVVHDIRKDARTSFPDALAAYAAISLRAFIIVPLVKDGRLTAYLYAAHPEARRWSEDDLALTREVAERTWAAVGRARAEAELRESEERLRLIVESARDYAILTIDPEGRIETWLPGAAHVFGWSAEEAVGQPAAMIFTTEDRQAGVPEWEIETARREGVAPDVRWHLRKDGARVFIEGSTAALRGADGSVRGFLKIGQDVTARKAAEERQALLAREVDHRAKNALAVVQAALRLTPKDNARAYATAVEGRVGALARAQTLLAEERWNGAGLRTLLQGELAPFLAGQRADLDGPPVLLPASQAQPLAMAVHELATNALKYGALSMPAGRVSVSWRLEGGELSVLRLRWAEAGGPPVAGPPSRRGFGSRVLDGTVRGQLGGAVSLSWEPTGLVCDIEVPLAREPVSGE